MKITKTQLKEIIAEELESLNELDPFGVSRGNDMPPTKSEKAAQDKQPSDKKGPGNLSKLGDEMIEVGRALKSSKIKGLDAKEIQLISAILANILETSSSGSAGTLLARINSYLGKK